MRGLPWEIPIAIGALVELGTIQANTLLRFEITARDPAGTVHVLGTTDAPVYANRDQINRTCVTEAVKLRVAAEGIYELGLRSGGFELAQFPFEVILPR